MKKSQVAMEFLMTYGWAILVVLAGIGALFYFGVWEKPITKEAKYCLEWDGWIDRENMVYNCYDFETKEVKCSWDIIQNERLIVLRLDNTTQEYNCTKYIMATEV